jgi:LSD1 subclass zinc finger protein
LGQTGLNGALVDRIGRAPFESRTPTTDRRAAGLLDQIYDTLDQWARAMARIHQLEISGRRTLMGEYVHTSRDYATFLAAHTAELAKDPDIAELCQSLHRYIKRGISLINRRVPGQYCGPCPTQITDHTHCTDCGYHRHDCGTRLMARRGATHVTCTGCGTLHDVEKLVNHLLARADHFRCTIPEMNRVLRMLGEPVPMRTLYSWAAAGRLKPSGYLRVNKKTIGITRHHPDDKPVYRVSDARKQRTEKSREAIKK